MSSTGFGAAPGSMPVSAVICTLMSVASTAAATVEPAATTGESAAATRELRVGAGGRGGGRRGDHDLLAGREPGLDLDEAAAGDADLDLAVLVLAVDLHLHRALATGGAQGRA